MKWSVKQGPFGCSLEKLADRSQKSGARSQEPGARIQNSKTLVQVLSILVFSVY